jgi:hypothetical protein
VYGNIVELLPNADTHLSQARLTKWHGNAERILGIVAGESGEEQTKILRVARHWADGGKQARRVAKHGRVAAAREAAGSGLESGDATEVGWNADGATAVAGDTTGRAVSRDGRRLAAAGPTGCPRVIPGIIGAAGDRVIGVVTGEHLGRVGAPEDDGALTAEPRDHAGILGGGRFGPRPASDTGGHPGDIEAVLDGDGDAVEHAECVGAIEGARFGECLFCADGNEGVERRITFLDPADVLLDELCGGDGAIAHQGRHETEAGAGDHEASVTC